MQDLTAEAILIMNKIKELSSPTSKDQLHHFADILRFDDGLAFEDAYDIIIQNFVDYSKEIERAIATHAEDLMPLLQKSQAEVEKLIKLLSDNRNKAIIEQETDKELIAAIDAAIEKAQELSSYKITATKQSISQPKNDSKKNNQVSPEQTLDSDELGLLDLKKSIELLNLHISKSILDILRNNLSEDDYQDLKAARYTIKGELNRFRRQIDSEISTGGTNSSQLLEEIQERVTKFTNFLESSIKSARMEKELDKEPFSNIFNAAQEIASYEVVTQQQDKLNTNSKSNTQDNAVSNKTLSPLALNELSKHFKKLNLAIKAVEKDIIFLPLADKTELFVKKRYKKDGTEVNIYPLKDVVRSMRGELNYLSRTIELAKKSNREIPTSFLEDAQTRITQFTNFLESTIQEAGKDKTKFDDLFNAANKILTYDTTKANKTQATHTASDATVTKEEKSVQWLYSQSQNNQSQNNFLAAHRVKNVGQDKKTLSSSTDAQNSNKKPKN